jgi:hypothetical protein
MRQSMCAIVIDQVHVINRVTLISSVKTEKQPLQFPFFSTINPHPIHPPSSSPFVSPSHLLVPSYTFSFTSCFFSTLHRNSQHTAHQHQHIANTVVPVPVLRCYTHRDAQPLHPQRRCVESHRLCCAQRKRSGHSPLR